MKNIFYQLVGENREVFLALAFTYNIICACTINIYMLTFPLGFATAASCLEKQFSYFLVIGITSLLHCLSCFQSYHQGSAQCCTIIQVNTMLT